MELIIGIVVGLVVGGGAVYAILRVRSVRLETQLEEREKAIDKRSEEFDTHFEDLASRIFNESLDKLREHVDDSDKARIADTTKVSQSIEQLMAETSGLRKILHNPQLRGQWGEQHLRNVLDAAGMKQHVDYFEQDTVSGAPDAARLRPDARVKIPGGATVVIDAKTPHDSYDKAMGSDDKQEQERLLAEHAAALASHAKDLASRDYAQRVEGSPDFVMMYVPTDPMLDAAIKVKPSIWQETWQRHRVLITTPGLLIAFLRTVALAWRQQDIQQNAQQIAEAGRELYDRLRTYAGHLYKMGRGLRQAVDAYNSGVGSFQLRVLAQARRFEELSATGNTERIGEPKQIENAIRQVDVPEQPHATGSSEKEELDAADDEEDAPEPPFPADSSD